MNPKRCGFNVKIMFLRLNWEIAGATWGSCEGTGMPHSGVDLDLHVRNARYDSSPIGASVRKVLDYASTSLG